MSVKRRSEKEDEEETVAASENASPDEDLDSWLDSYSSEKSSTTDQTKVSTSEITVEENEEEKTASPKQIFHEQLPAWIKKPFMYVQPTHEGHLSSWLTSWEQLIIAYARILEQHILVINELLAIHPFNHATNNRQLSYDQLVRIVDEMVNKELAKWMDENRQVVRIYYKSDTSWSEEIYNFLIGTGRAAEVLTLFELKKLDEDWSSLPLEELREIFDILVEKEKAKWVDKEKESVKVLF